jgi:hypothetical protein
MITNPVILDRLLRGPMFRETPNADFPTAYRALKSALQNLVERRKHILADAWMQKVLRAFQQKAQELIAQDKNKEIDLQSLLFSAKESIKDHEEEPHSILEKCVLLQADKCRGNYMLICKNLYIRQCVNVLHSAPEYEKMEISSQNLTARLLQDISGLIHHVHLDFLMQERVTRLPYFYTLPKPHRIPNCWRPVAAAHRAVQSIPQRILSQCLEKVMKTLKDFHHKEFQETGIRKFWIVENSLDIVLSLPETLTSMSFSIPCIKT